MDYFKAFAAECDKLSIVPPSHRSRGVSWYSYVCLLSAALTPEAVATPESGTCPGEHDGNTSCTRSRFLELRWISIQISLVFCTISDRGVGEYLPIDSLRHLVA